MNQRNIQLGHPERLHLNTPDSYQKLFTSCLNGDLDAAKLHIETMTYRPCGQNMTTLFNVACLYDHVDIVKWLYSKIAHIDDLQNLIGENDVTEGLFRFVCQHGALHVTQWLYETRSEPGHRKINIHVGFPGDENSKDEGFYSACVEGHLDIARWFYHLSLADGITQDMKSYGDEEMCILEEICQNNHFEVAKWIYDISLSQGHHCKLEEYGAAIFTTACKAGNLKIAQ
jgi:hypothetical protein